MNPLDIMRGAKGLAKSNLNIDIASEDVINSRLNICDSCSKKDNTKDKCTACGCKLYHKTRLKSESCPIGKW